MSTAHPNLDQELAEISAELLQVETARHSLDNHYTALRGRLFRLLDTVTDGPIEFIVPLTGRKIGRGLRIGKKGTWDEDSLAAALGTEFYLVVDIKPVLNVTRLESMLETGLLSKSFDELKPQCFTPSKMEVYLINRSVKDVDG